MGTKLYCSFYGAYAKIYCLKDSKGNVFYVGRTISDLSDRLRAHINESKTIKHPTAKTEKIKRLDYRITIQLLETIYVTGSHPIRVGCKARSRELFWIKEMIAKGYNLMNKENQPYKYRQKWKRSRAALK